jgi:drug/metabolite transporter (DMT)-like permease
MWILFLCIILNAFIGVIFKMFQIHGINNFQAIVVNYFVCVVMAAIFVGGNPLPEDIIAKPWFYYSMGLGVLFIIVFNIMAVTVQNFGVIIATIFQKMSMIAPAVVAIVFYGEKGGFLKWLGIAAAVIAIVLLSYEKNDKKNSVRRSGLLWFFPLATFAGSCVIDTALFLIEEKRLTQPGDLGFIATLFLMAGIVGLSYLSVQLTRKKIIWENKSLIGGIGLGIPNFFSIYLLILALNQGWGGSVVFPVNNVGILTVAAIFGIIFFKENISNTKWVGFLLAMISIFIITVV